VAAPTDAAIAELKEALEKCCSNLAEALAAQEAAEQAEASEEGASSLPGAADALRWRALTLGDLPGVDQLVTATSAPLKAIIAVLQVVQALLKALAAILIGLPDPFRALIMAAYALITDIINDLLNTGVYLYVDAPGIQPTETNLAETGMIVTPPKDFKAGMALQRPPPVVDGFARWAGRFAASFDDPGDLRRPVVTPGAPIEAVFIVMAAPSLDALRGMLYLLGQLFNIDAFKKAFEKYAKGSPDPRRSRVRGNPVAPNWQSVKLPDLIPPLKDLATLPETLLGLLKSIDALSTLIKDLAKAIEAKAALLGKLADSVQAIINLLEALKSAGMYTLPVSTQGGVNGLRQAFVSATNRPPGGFVGGICLLASGPNFAKAAMLWELLGLATAFELASEVAEGELSVGGALEQATAGARAAADKVLSPAGKEISDAAGNLVSTAVTSAEAFADAVTSVPGEIAQAVGRLPEEVAQGVKRGRAELVELLERAQNLLPNDENIRQGIAATRQAQRHSGRSLAMGFGGALPSTAPPPSKPLEPKEKKS